jgi:hypothetical protein
MYKSEYIIDETLFRDSTAQYIWLFYTLQSN